jgi:hypothetical protein
MPPPVLLAPGTGAPPCPPPFAFVGAVGRGLDDVDEVEEVVALVELPDVAFPVAKGRTVVKTWVLRKVVSTLLGPRPTDERIVVVVTVVDPARLDELFWINSEYAVGEMGTQVPVRGPSREG